MAANDLRLETLDQILQNLGLGALCQRFRDEKVDIGIFSSLSDADLCRLGVETLGDRIRLREVVSSCSSSASSSSSTQSHRQLPVHGQVRSAVDLGGPRKEFFTLVLQKIQEKYFDPVKEWSGDYEVIGKIMALSMLQNGKLPRIMTPECISEVFASDTPLPFIRDLKRGLDALGLIQLASRMPSVIHLFTPQTVQLTFRMVSSLLNPQFSQPGSNQILLEKEVYRQFNNYLREAAAGRRQGVNLGSVLRFATGAEEEPVLGFTIPPSLHFVSATSFLPSANTCTNRLNLTIPTGNVQLPSREELFRLYDYGFVNSYFGYE